MPGNHTGKTVSLLLLNEKSTKGCNSKDEKDVKSDNPNRRLIRLLKH
jgi:hypothetical protein